MLLDEVARSPFAQTPHESFHTMQEDWKMEIEAMFDDIRVKEKVENSALLIQFSIFNYVNEKFRNYVVARRNCVKLCSNKSFTKNI